MRIFRVLTVALLITALLGASAALGEETYYGSVTCEQTLTIPAPFSGILEEMPLRKGDLIHANDLICSIEAVTVHSPVEGVVSAVWGAGGDSVEDVKTRCGGVVYIVPANRLTVKANIRDAVKDPDNYVSPGQTVWLQKGRNQTAIVAEGIISSVSGEGESSGDFSVEFDSPGFAMDETVSVYRREDRAAYSLLGYGTVEQTAPVVINGEGSILKVYVKPGSKVSRGSPLFETVSGTLKDMKANTNRILADTDGIVASVEAATGAHIEQNSPLITMYPLDSMRVCISVPETDLANFPEGRKVKLIFSSNDEREGTVQTIDYLAEASETATSAMGYANYTVHIDFEQKDEVREGMLVTVEIPSTVNVSNSEDNKTD